LTFFFMILMHMPGARWALTIRSLPRPFRKSSSRHLSPPLYRGCLTTDHRFGAVVSRSSLSNC
jgi:hypothetical protein